MHAITNKLPEDNWAASIKPCKKMNGDLLIKNPPDVAISKAHRLHNSILYVPPMPVKL